MARTLKKQTQQKQITDINNPNLQEEPMGQKLTIETKGLSYEERDEKVMLVLLKLIAFYKQKDRTLYLGKWTKFFNELFPAEVKKGSVFAVGRAKKFLVSKGYVNVIQPNGKEYHLLQINADKIQQINTVLEKYYDPSVDDVLFELIQEYYDANDAEGGSFQSADVTFGSMGL